METPTKSNLASNEIVEVPLLQEGRVDAASVEKSDNLIDKRFNRGYRRLQQAQKTGLTVSDASLDNLILIISEILGHAVYCRACQLIAVCIV